MKPFEALTGSGQTRRLRKLALTALNAWSLDIAKVSLIAVHTNTLFRVIDRSQTKYALCVCEPGEHNDVSVLCEVTWLAFSTLRAAFRSGYESIRSWPVQSERQLSLLMAGRMVSFVNYVSHSFSADSAEIYLTGWFKELQHLLDNNFQ